MDYKKRILLVNDNFIEDLVGRVLEYRGCEILRRNYNNIFIGKEELNNLDMATFLLPTTVQENLEIVRDKVAMLRFLFPKIRILGMSYYSENESDEYFYFKDSFDKLISMTDTRLYERADLICEELNK